MKDKKPEDGEIDLRELEKQLSCPSGQTGIEVANMMHATNISMTLNTIDFLGLMDQHSVLELGHGNCGHLRNLLSKARNLNYQGLELSETMVEEAQKINGDLIASHDISFGLYDGIHLPFENERFDRIMGVNTIYFWSDPATLLKEIGRTLKPNGYCVITFVQKEFMKKLPFVSDRFRLYDDNDITELISKTNMKLVEITGKTEQVTTKTGEIVERTYSMAKISR